jgi:cellulose synthase/poly-beta-1,6-N-acetylglucosamine synthase-like glycosyltransferase
MTREREARRGYPVVETSVIIPFKDAERTLERCLTSLIAQSYESFEVILVDNNSTDGSLELVKSIARRYGEKLSIRVFREARSGPSEARNAGVRNAVGRFLAFTDSDCVAHPDWLRETIETFDDPNVGAVAGNIEGYTPSNVVEAFNGLFTLQGLRVTRTFTNFSLDSGGFSTTNLVVRRDVFELAGEFDPLLGANCDLCAEDHDLCARIYRSGFSIKTIPGGTIYHIHRADLKATWRQARLFGVGHSMLLKKHFRRLILIELGRFQWRTHRLPLKAWIDLSTADKKMVAILFLSFLYPPLAVLVPAYVLYLSRLVVKRAKRSHVRLRPMDSVAMAGLLLIKSMAMTAGRLQGSFRYGVVAF